MIRKYKMSVGALVRVHNGNARLSSRARDEHNFERCIKHSNVACVVVLVSNVMFTMHAIW